MDIMEGNSAMLIKEFTGLPIERCEKIKEIYFSLRK